VWRPVRVQAARLRLRESNIQISAISERPSYLLVVSIAALLTYEAGAAPVDHGSHAPMAQATATFPRKPVVERASWYNPRMNGHKTATGERFSSRKMTAAAKGVPLGSNVIVTNLKTGRSVQVRINDCGHFKPGRELHLSRSAA
jgi:hypothetical protein